MPRKLIIASAMLVALASPVAADESPLAVSLEERTFFGFDDVSDLTLFVLGVGGEARFTPSLSLRGMLLAMLPVGTTDDGDAAVVGAGADLALRLYPWPDLTARPWAQWGVGALVFPTDFLPGGTRYDFIVSFGFGADFVITERWSLGAGAHLTHLSNGQGLGEHNPAYDGAGFSVSSNWGLGPLGSIPSPWRAYPEPEGARPGWAPGVTVDASVGRGDEELWASSRLRLAQRLADPLLVMIDGDVGSFADETFGEIGLALVTHAGPTTFAVHGGHRRWAGIEVWLAAVQGEVHASEEISIVANAHYEDAGDFFGDLWRGALGLRAYPLRALFVELGWGLDAIGEGGESDPYFSLEWRFPIESEDWHLALFVERQVAAVSLLGLRADWGAGQSPRDFSRSAGWRRIR